MPAEPDKALIINDEALDQTRVLGTGEQAVDGDGRVVQVMVRSPNDPTGTDVNHPIGTDWLNTTTGVTRRLVSVVGGVATWPTHASSHSHVVADTTGLQAALDGKAPTSHAHVVADTTGLQAALDGKAPTSHAHAQADVTDLVADLAGKAPTVHGHAIADTTGLQDALDGKAPTSHAHVIADTTGLQAALDGKAPTAHSHVIADVTGLTAELASKATLVHFTRDPQATDVYAAGTLWMNDTLGSLHASLGSGRWVTMAAQQAMILAEDWITGSATGLLGWTNTAANGGTVTWDSTLQSATVRGVLNLTVASGNINGRAMTSIYSGGTGPYVMSRGIGFQVKIQVPTVGAVGNHIRGRIGFCDVLIATSTAEMNNGFWLEHDSVVSANWLLRSAAAGVRSTVITATPVVAGVWIEVEMRASLDNTSINCYINGTLIGSISTTLPTASTNNFFPYIGITRLSTVGTLARSLYINEYVANYLF